jgi:ABC-type branched-subunit amino acid transport system substrate-binding protein
VRAAHRRLGTAVAVLAAMVALGACGSDSGGSGPKKLDLKLGDLLPRTGFLEQFGEPSQQASDLAIDEIRKAAAKAGAQHKVTITHVDFRSDAKRAIELSTQLVDRGTSCLVGPWGGVPITRVLKQVSIPRKVVQILPSASGDALSKAEDRGYLFRVVPPDRMQADALVELLDDTLHGARGKKVNVAALQSTYGKNLAAEFDDAWTGKGGKIGKRVLYRADQPTFADEGNALASGDPDAWVFFDFAETYARLANDLVGRTDVKFSPRRAFGTDSLANPRLASISPTASDGLRGVGVGAPKSGATAEEFDRRFTARGPAKRQTFDAQEFDAVVLCYLSAVAAGSTSGKEMAKKVQAVSAPPGRKFTWMQLDQAVKALEAGQDIDYDGASGPIDLNHDGDPTAGVYDVYEFRNARITVGKQIAVPPGKGGI